MAQAIGKFIADVVGISWLIEVALITLPWVLLCGKKERRLRNWLDFAGLLALLCAANFASMVLSIVLGGGYQPLWGVMLGVITAIYLFVRLDFHLLPKAALWCSMFAGTCCISALARQMGTLSEDFILGAFQGGIIRCLVSLLTIPLALYLRAFNFDRFREISSNGLALIIAEDGVMLVLSGVEALWFGSDYRLSVVFAVMYICLFTLMLLSISVLYSICEEQAEVAMLQTERQRLQGEREMEDLIQQNLETLRSIRHDLKNQYAYMGILLDEGRYDELKTYFAGVSEGLPVPLTSVDCGNRTVNGILNMELGKARSAGIAVSHQLVVPPVLPFHDDAVCSVLSNLLDNAIEECRRLQTQGREDTEIRLEIYPQKSYLYILCRNTTDRVRLDRCEKGLRSTKKDRSLHGFGTRIVARAAERYNGCVEYSLKEGTFVAKVLLDMMAGESYDQNRAV
ncbi:MAG: sensor histidine kinase [Candidatus Onthomonas sp.]